MSSREAIIMLGDQEFIVKALRVKEIKKLARFVVRVVRDFQVLTTITDDDSAIAALDQLLEKPEEFMHYLAPNVPAEVIEEAYLDELVDAVKTLVDLQGFNRLRELADPFATLLSATTGELPPKEEDGTTSTPSLSSITEGTQTTSMSGK